MKRKFLSVALVLVMLLAVMPAALASSVSEHLSMDFEDASIGRLTADAVGTVLGGATLSDTAHLYEDAEKTALEITTDSLDETKGKVLKLYNNSAETNALSITIPFTSAYTASGDDFLIWEMDYKLLTGTGTHYNFADILDSSETTSLMFQKMSANTLRIKDATNVIYKNFNTSKDTWVHQKVVIDVKGGSGGTGEIVSLSNTADGVTTAVSLTQNVVPSLKDNAAALKLSLTLSNDTSYQEYYIDNINIYSVPVMRIYEYTGEDGGDVLVDQNVTATFTNAIADTSALITSISTGDGIVDTSTYTVTPSADNKSVVISFPDNMKYDTTYTVTFSNAVDENGLALSDSFSFTTEPTPPVTVEDTTIYKGAGSGAAVASQLTAGDGLQSVQISLQNNTDEEKNVLLLLAVYNSSRELLSVSYVSTALADSEAADVIQGMNIPASVSGGYVKVFTWNQFTELNPYVAVKTLSIQ